MEKEDRELLLKDLSGRCPYGVYISPVDSGKAILIGIKDGNPLLWDTIHKKEYDKPWDIEYIKPYLRPMSSMTEEEYKEAKTNGCIIYHDTSPKNRGLIVIASPKGIDWLNAHHFDYRGLIEKGLAIAVTKENNPYEKK